MKILHISKYHHPFTGGIERFVADLAREQTRCGHSVRIVCHAHDAKAPTIFENVDGLDVVRVRTPVKMVYAPISPSMPAALFREIKQFRPDVVHAHMPNLAPFWLLAWPNAPAVVVHWHADATGGAGDRRIEMLYPFYRPFERALLRKAHTVIATSPPYLEASPALKPFRDKCEVIPLGLDPGPCDAPTDEPDPSDDPDGRPMILSVGRFTFYKGFDLLVRAAEHVPGARFVMAGGGRELAGVRELAGRLGLGDRVSFPGRVSDAELGRLMDRCDVLCLPSTDRAEAFGMVLLQAMSRGKALVSTTIPGSGTGWVNANGETGLTVPPGDVQALAKALETLAADPELRRSMGQNSLRRFQQHFHIRAAEQAMDRVYRSAIL